MRFLLSFILTFFIYQCYGSDEVVVDLKDASYEEGIIYTSKGGVVSKGCLRIQARCITYIKKKSEGKDIEKIYASKDILVIFKDKLLVGSSLEFDFEKNEGVLLDGIVVQEPWVVGGKKLHFKTDGSYKLVDGFLTLCDSTEQDFAIRADIIDISKCGIITANDIHLRLFDFPLFSFPDIKSNAEALLDLPVQVRFTLGGIEGSYVTLRYKALQLENLRAFLRADWVFNRGPGGGFDIDYCNKQANRFFYAKNFAVWDRSYDDPNNFFRYRFEGNYRECFLDGKTQAKLTYDFLSDTEMGTDFSADEFNLETGQATELIVNHKEDLWMADFTARAKVNSFQTVNQELPAVAVGVKPLSLGNSGIISDTRFKAGYLNYAYAEGTPNVSDFESSRVELDENFFRPFNFAKYAKFTPEVGAFLIHYGTDNYNSSAMQAIGYYGLNLSTEFFKTFETSKHIIQPYLCFKGWTSPTVSQNAAPIFTINDGFSKLQLVRLGITNSIYEKCFCNSIVRTLWLDLYTYGFYGINTMEKRVPRIYAALNFVPIPTLTCKVETGFNRETNSLDIFNMFYLWTLNEDFALGVDLLSRGPRWWRKCQYENFMLDAFRSEEELQNSLLSDRRNTFLAHLFYRFHPNWKLEAKTRIGWNRQYQNPYYEYKIDLETVIGCNWHLKFGYEHREIDNRFIFSFRLGLQRPGTGLYD